MKQQALFTRISLLILILSAVACSSGQPDVTEEKQEKQVTNLPQWVLNPSIPNGVASAQCVRWSGNLAVDKAEAESLGRSDLAKQLNLRVRVLEKTYLSSQQGSQSKEVSSGFESVSRQTAEMTMTGSRVEKVEVVEIAGESKLCVFLVLSQTSQDVFKEILKRSKASVKASEKEALYQKYKFELAQQELKTELPK